MFGAVSWGIEERQTTKMAYNNAGAYHKSAFLSCFKIKSYGHIRDDKGQYTLRYINRAYAHDFINNSPKPINI